MKTATATTPGWVTARGKKLAQPSGCNTCCRLQKTKKIVEDWEHGDGQEDCGCWVKILFLSKTSWKFLVLTLLCLITYCAFGMHGWTPLYIPRGLHRNVGQCHWRHRRPQGSIPMAFNTPPMSGRFLLAMSQAPSGSSIFKCDQPMKLFSFSPKSPDGT